MLELFILLTFLVMILVGFPFMLIGILHLFGFDIGYVPALVSYLAILLVSNVIFSGKK